MAIIAVTGDGEAKRKKEKRRKEKRRPGHGPSRTRRSITDVHGPGRPGEEEEREKRRGGAPVDFDLQVRVAFALLEGVYEGGEGAVVQDRVADDGQDAIGRAAVLDELVVGGEDLETVHREAGAPAQAKG